MVNMDLPWNPMQIEQRLGRLHRVGQDHDVLLTNLVASGTIEEQMLRVLEAKINLFELVVGELDMILGRVDDDFDFESTVFDAFVASGDDAEFAERMAAIGDNLARARTDYLASRAAIDNLVGDSGRRRMTADRRSGAGASWLAARSGVADGLACCGRRAGRTPSTWCCRRALRDAYRLPEELRVTADPDVAREDGATLLAAGHPVLAEAADRVLACGDAGYLLLARPASLPPGPDVLLAEARDAFPVDHGRIDLSGEPAVVLHPVVRVGALRHLRAVGRGPVPGAGAALGGPAVPTLSCPRDGRPTVPRRGR